MMNTLNAIKEKKIVITVFAVILSIVIFLSHMKLNIYIMNIYHDEYVIVSGFIYVLLILLWSFSIRYRIIEKDTKKYLTYICYLMMYFIIARSVKWVSVNYHYLQIFLWYTYYIPMILMPNFLLLISVSLDKNLYKKYRKNLSILYIISFLFIIFVMTNFYHEYIFTILEWTGYSDKVEHNFGYYLVYSYIGLLCFSSILFIVKNSKIPQKNKRIKLPIFIIIFYGIYAIMYNINPTIRGMGYIEFSIAVCLIIATIIESLIQSRLIPSNSDYKMIFENIDIPMLIIDDYGSTIYKSKTVFPLDQNIYKDIEPDISLIINNNKYSSKKITGGSVLWTSDISKSNKKILEIKSTINKIEEKNQELEKQLATQKKELAIKHKNEIYEKIEAEIKTKKEDIYEIIDKNDLSKNDFVLVLLIATYIKRLSNIILISTNTSIVNMLELQSAILESLYTFSLLNETSHSQHYLEYNIDLELSKKIYEYFESELEFYLYKKTDCDVSWFLKENDFVLCFEFKKEDIECSDLIIKYMEFFELSAVLVKEENEKNRYKIEFYIKEEKNEK